MLNILTCYKLGSITLEPHIVSRHLKQSSSKVILVSCQFQKMKFSYDNLNRSGLQTKQNKYIRTKVYQPTSQFTIHMMPVKSVCSPEL
jgi:hypothetical protein